MCESVETAHPFATREVYYTYPGCSRRSGAYIIYIVYAFSCLAAPCVLCVCRSVSIGSVTCKHGHSMTSKPKQLQKFPERPLSCQFVSLRPSSRPPLPAALRAASTHTTCQRASRSVAFSPRTPYRLPFPRRRPVTSLTLSRPTRLLSRPFEQGRHYYGSGDAGHCSVAGAPRQVWRRVLGTRARAYRALLDPMGMSRRSAMRRALPCSRSSTLSLSQAPPSGQLWRTWLHRGRGIEVVASQRTWLHRGKGIAMGWLHRGDTWLHEGMRGTLGLYCLCFRILQNPRGVVVTTFTCNG